MTEIKKDHTRNILAFLAYFVLSAIITWVFIQSSPVYSNETQMKLSGNIAGAKWFIQILAAFFFLKEEKWEFLERIGATCFLGSTLLIPYLLSSFFFAYDPASFFVFSLLAAVLLMIFLYYKSVVASGLSLKWWYGWLICLAIAITLQLTVVFRLI